jgi:hypothetical protein
MVTVSINYMSVPTAKCQQILVSKFLHEIFLSNVLYITQRSGYLFHLWFWTPFTLILKNQLVWLPVLFSSSVNV